MHWERLNTHPKLENITIKNDKKRIASRITQISCLYSSSESNSCDIESKSQDEKEELAQKEENIEFLWFVEDIGNSWYKYAGDGQIGEGQHFDRADIAFRWDAHLISYLSGWQLLLGIMAEWL